jgi:hypothetical protein
MTVNGSSGRRLVMAMPPSSTWRAPGTCPAMYSCAWRTSTTWPFMAAGSTMAMVATGLRSPSRRRSRRPARRRAARGRCRGTGGPARRDPGRRRRRIRAAGPGRRASRASWQTRAAACWLGDHRLVGACALSTQVHGSCGARRACCMSSGCDAGDEGVGVAELGWAVERRCGFDAGVVGVGVDAAPAGQAVAHVAAHYETVVD